MSIFGDAEFTCDRDATIAAYAAVERGGAEKCACNGCRNFVKARGKIFPPAFTEFLRTLGVDPKKDAEIHRNARLAPGRHDYGGWFHFVGSLKGAGGPSGDFGRGFSASLRQSTAPGHKSLTRLPSVQLEFHTDRAPWVLEEPEPD